MGGGGIYEGQERVQVEIVGMGKRGKYSWDVVYERSKKIRRMRWKKKKEKKGEGRKKLEGKGREGKKNNNKMISDM